MKIATSNRKTKLKNKPKYKSPRALSKKLSKNKYK